MGALQKGGWKLPGDAKPGQGGQPVVSGHGSSLEGRKRASWASSLRKPVPPGVSESCRHWKVGVRLRSALRPDACSLLPAGCAVDLPGLAVGRRTATEQSQGQAPASLWEEALSMTEAGKILSRKQ